MDTSGFYKVDNDDLLYGPNYVMNDNCFLLKEQQATYTYPIDDWYWFDNEDVARQFFNLPTAIVE